MTNSQNEYVRPKGPVHLMVGSAGALQNEKWFQPSPAWSAIRFSYGPHVAVVKGGGEGGGSGSGGGGSGSESGGSDVVSNFASSRSMMDSYGFVRVDVHGIKYMNISFISINNKSVCNDSFSIVR